jgi:hypothetical protein
MTRRLPGSDQIARLWQDVHHGARSLRKDAGLSAIVVATLALGIGLSVGIFSYVNAALLRAHVDRKFESYARVYTQPSPDAARRGPAGDPTWDEYLAFRDQSRTLRDLAAWTRFEAIVGTTDAQPVRALFVTCNFFDLSRAESSSAFPAKARGVSRSIGSRVEGQ